ncbi:22-dialkylglycine decarboxylase [Fusarium albosuccineum]|uniref:22-dialkylglycine decarboxylase n=1 Tax=Fusarium albosuccineum TaxID=1237068 RepID=A0A8H4L7T2_9HYPO|nr:22-dialkylglycine decarboxylase [Fusarium albosuccineum]
MCSASPSNDRLYADAQAYLLTFGSPFMPDIVTRTQGLYFWTASGKKVMDWTSGQMSCLIGHGHPEIVQALQHHAESLDHLYSGMVSPPVIELGKRLTAALPDGLDKAIFLSTGSESNECAIKLAKTVTGKFEIVGLGASWHGMTSGANGAQYHAGRKGYGPLVSPHWRCMLGGLADKRLWQMPGMHMLPSPDAYRSIFRHPDGSYDWETELNYGWSLVDKASCGSLAAVIMEPILYSGGIIAVPDGYMSTMKKHCEKRGMLLIVDEAQTAMGRSGHLFAIEHEGIVPDILTLSKTLGNGLPLSAVVASNSIAKQAEERNFLFYTTHANDPLPASVGLKVLEVVQRDNLVEEARKKGARLHAGLWELYHKYACIGDIRGRGLMAGVEIVSDRETKAADIGLGRRLSGRMMELGLSATISARTTFSGCIRIAPSVTISEEELEEGLGIFEEALRTTEGSQPIT